MNTASAGGMKAPKKPIAAKPATAAKKPGKKQPAFKRVEDMTPEEIKAAAEKAVDRRNQRDIKACTDEVSAALIKYNCQLLPIVNIVGNQIRPAVDIVHK